MCVWGCVHYVPLARCVRSLSYRWLSDCLAHLGAPSRTLVTHSRFWHTVSSRSLVLGACGQDLAMAPRRSGAAVAKAGSKRKAPAAPLVAAKGVVEKQEATSLAAQLEAGASDVPKEGSAKKRTRTEDAAITKVLVDNFPGFSEEELYINEFDGRTLAAQVRYDRSRAQAGEKVVMGKSYYNDLRKKYQSPDSVWGKLRVGNEGDAEDPELLAALVAFHSQKRSVEELFLWCETTAAINQKMLIGLLRTILKAPPSKSMQSANITKSVMTMCVRLNLRASYPAEMAVMNAHWDACCCKSLASYKSQGRSGVVWWQSNKQWAQLLLPASSTEKALTEEKDLSKVEAEINQVVASSEVGCRLLSLAQRQLKYHAVTAMIDSIMAKIKVCALKQDTLNEGRQEFMKNVRATGGDPTCKLPPKRCLSCTAASRS